MSGERRPEADRDKNPADVDRAMEDLERDREQAGRRERDAAAGKEPASDK